MEPLEKYRVPEDRDWPVDRVGKLLNLAIDRINELQAKYEGHHHHLHDGQNTETTPPTNNVTRGGE